MRCKDREKSCLERLDTSPSATSIDVLVCDRSIARAKLTVAGVRRVDANASIVRVLDATQAHRLIFEQGLFTREPQIPRLLLIERAISNNGPLQEALQQHWKTMWLPVIEIVSSVERFRWPCTQPCIVETVDRERYVAAVAHAVAPHLMKQRSLPSAQRHSSSSVHSSG